MSTSTISSTPSTYRVPDVLDHITDPKYRKWVIDIREKGAIFGYGWWIRYPELNNIKMKDLKLEARIQEINARGTSRLTPIIILVSIIAILSIASLIVGIYLIYHPPLLPLWS